MTKDILCHIDTSSINICVFIESQTNDGTHIFSYGLAFGRC